MLYWMQNFVKILLKFDKILTRFFFAEVGRISSPRRSRSRMRRRSSRTPKSPSRARAAPSPPIRRRGSFSAGSTPIFASKYSFCSIFQNLQENHLLASKFVKILQNFAELCTNLTFGGKFCKTLQFQIFLKFCRTFYRILQNLWILKNAEK